MPAARWIDLLDPSEEDVRTQAPWPLHPSTVELLVARGRDRRPRFQSIGTYVVGVFILTRLVPDEDRVYDQELDVVAAADAVLTVRKTPPDGEPYDLELLRDAFGGDERPGMILYRLVDSIAEQYLDLVDGLDEEIEELEDHIDDWPARQVRRRLADVRHDMLHVRRVLAPTRDAVREVVDGRVELDEGELFPRDVELAFGNAYDKLVRGSEGLDFSRDLLASVRDYLQSRVATDQNEVMKRLTAIASILLVPTFIVGLYGQNFKDIPEVGWSWGYGWSWGLIVATTVVQLFFYRRKGWI
jgi:magnesium transporter